MTALFWLLFATLFWCYLGYPVAMAWMARSRRLPPGGGAPVGEPPVSVVLAVRNGAEHLDRRLENLLASDYPADRLEIVVVCNGCTDATEALASAWSERDPRVRVVPSSGDSGKSGALNAGVKRATGEFVLFADVRQTWAPDAVRRLLEPFSDPGVGAVSGRLVIGRSDRAAVEGVRWYWGMETALRLAESRTGSVVGATGAIYAIRRELFEMLPPNLILDDVYLPVRIAMRGYRVLLEPQAVAHDVASGEQRHEYLRKRRTMVGNLQLMRAVPGLLSPRANPIFGRYVAHKLLRILSPLCLGGMMVTAAFLPGAVYRLAFWGLASAYLAGVAGLITRHRLLAVASAFVLVQAAILAALLRARQDAAAVWTSGAPVGPAAHGSAVLSAVAPDIQAAPSTVDSGS